VSGEEIAARAGGRNPYAARETYVTGSLGGRKPLPRPHKAGSKEDEFEDE
jgi:hypothetical protein